MVLVQASSRARNKNFSLASGLDVEPVDHERTAVDPTEIGVARGHLLARAVRWHAERRVSAG